jgi:hypothetical protein
MGFLQLLEAASMPVIQVLLISALGAFMATQYFNNLLSPDFRKSLNKVTNSNFILFFLAENILLIKTKSMHKTNRDQ